MSALPPSSALARLVASSRHGGGASVLSALTPSTKLTTTTTTSRQPLHAPFSTHFRHGIQRRQLSQSVRLGAGGKKGAKDNTLVLEKPDKFRPPSHPARLRSKNSNSSGGRPVRNYGPDTTAAERDAMAKKAYPNMMPPEGSVMHWLLTSRAIHLWITIAVLSSLGAWALVLNVKQSSPFADMLPSGSQLLWHPLDSAYQAVQVLKLSSEHTSKLTAEKRARELDEVRKRKAYRLAHGLEGMDGIDEADPVFAAALASRLERESREKKGSEGVENAEREEGGREEEREKRARPVRKWLGIW